MTVVRGVRRLSILLFLFVTGAQFVAPGRAGADEPPGNPLAPFARFIGGEWRLDGSINVLEWGAGRKSVRSRGYFLEEGQRRLVSEGMWYWHPGERTIKGHFVATDMPVVLFEYTTTFVGDTMVNELTTVTADGEVSQHLETWEPTAEGRYAWTLYGRTPRGLRKSAEGVFERRAER